MEDVLEGAEQGQLTIPLTQGKVALVDAGDLPLIASHSWCADPSLHTWYAQTRIAGRTIRMHLLLVGATGLRIDHINGDGLDNRRSNLRLSTASQNNANQRPRGGYSAFKGVT